MQINQIILLVIIGLIGGVMSGGLGVGGGIVIIPALVILFGLSQHQAQGAFIGIVVFPVSIFAAINYYKSGNLDIRYSLIMMITFVIGSFIGSFISNEYISDVVLRKVFGVMMLLASIKMIFFK